jgi:hypothetical protein
MRVVHILGGSLITTEHILPLCPPHILCADTLPALSPCCGLRPQAARLHAAARAVSGGAIYVSDKPGQHDFDLLRELVLPDGSVLRGKLPGRPTRCVAGVVCVLVVAV